MAPPQGREAGPPGPRWPGREDEKLDRGLVVGLLLEVVLDTAAGLPDSQARRTLVKTRLKHTLVSLLAGAVTLDRFRTLMGRLDHWFALYYPLLSRAGQPPVALESGEGNGPLFPPSSSARVLRDETLENWRQNTPGLLPSRRPRKLSWGKLKSFLETTRGRWFGVKDFAQHLTVDRKTAWEYLQKLRGAGLLQHNQAHSAAARYCLAARFLVVRAEALRGRLAQELKDWPRALAAQVADGLIATAGEPFWEEDWQVILTPGQRRELLHCLTTAQVLEPVAQSGPNRMLRLRSRWLQGPEVDSSAGNPPTPI
jgi:predicted transcriptional regulator